MAQPAFLLQDNAALAAMQVDIDQAAFGLGKIKGAEFTPVGQRPPVAFFISMPTSLLQSLFATQVP